jgi:hypothetical protein
MKVEDVPDEAWRALRQFVLERPYGYDYREAVVAILNAWPEAYEFKSRNGQALSLPLKDKNDE